MKCVLVISDHPSALSAPPLKPTAQGPQAMGQCACVCGSQSGAAQATVECTLSLRASPKLAFHSGGDWIVKGKKQVGGGQIEVGQPQKSLSQSDMQTDSTRYGSLHLKKRPGGHRLCFNTSPQQTKMDTRAHTQTTPPTTATLCVQAVWLLEQS